MIGWVGSEISHDLRNCSAIRRVGLGQTTLLPAWVGLCWRFDVLCWVLNNGPMTISVEPRGLIGVYAYGLTNGFSTTNNHGHDYLPRFLSEATII